MPDAASITDLQSCQRRFLLSREYRRLRWSPKRLFDACLRQAIIDVSNGASLEKSRADARTQFLQSAANPGLNALGNTYAIAKEWVTLLDVIVCALPKIGVPSGLRTPEPIRLNSVTTWELSSHLDAAGSLHRFVTVDRWGESDFRRELHGWWLAGDIAASNTQMILHAFDIGQMRQGKRASPWVRAWRHPSIPQLSIRFRHADGKPMRGWDPVRLADGHYDVEAWVDQLWKEGTGQGLTHVVTIEPPTEEQRSRVLRDILLESGRMRRLEEDSGTVSWQTTPMSRGACDGIVPCPYQDICYGGIVNVEESGLYVRRASQQLVGCQ